MAPPPSPSFNQSNHSAGTHAEFEPMLQSMRTRHSGLARQLVALWFVLFFACSFSHAHAGAPVVPTDASAAHQFAAQALHTSACHLQLGLDSAAAEACNSLQHSPLTQQLLTQLGLAALLGLAAAFDLLPGLYRRLGGAPALTAISPGLPTPMRKQLHRYNE